jgi:hypothetical protein
MKSRTVLWCVDRDAAASESPKILLHAQSSIFVSQVLEEFSHRGGWSF